MPRKKSKTSLFDFTSPATAVRSITRLDYFHPTEELDGDVAIPCQFVEGGANRLLLVLGDNASGKSFFRRLVTITSKDDGIRESIHLSMEGRGGLYGSMIYGDETCRATGANSAHVVTMGIKTCAGRTHDHVIIWDEPDIGLSENAAAGAGLALGRFVNAPPDHTKLIMVTTHSRVLVRYLLQEVPDPHYLWLGSQDGPPTLQAWLDRPITPMMLEDLEERSFKRFQAIQKLLDRG